jgi:hypothetical protein
MVQQNTKPMLTYVYGSSRLCLSHRAPWLPILRLRANQVVQCSRATDMGECVQADSPAKGHNNLAAKAQPDQAAVYGSLIWTRPKRLTFPKPLRGTRNSAFVSSVGLTCSCEKGGTAMVCPSFKQEVEAPCRNTVEIQRRADEHIECCGGALRSLKGTVYG